MKANAWLLLSSAYLQVLLETKSQMFYFPRNNEKVGRIEETGLMIEHNSLLSRQPHITAWCLQPACYDHIFILRVMRFLLSWFGSRNQNSSFRESLKIDIRTKSQDFFCVFIFPFELTEFLEVSCKWKILKRFASEVPCIFITRFFREFIVMHIYFLWWKHC